MPRREFTKEDAVKGAHASVAVRQSRALERQRKSEIVHRIVSEIDDLSPAALERTLSIIEAVDPDALPVEDWLDAKRAIDVAEAAFRIHRLASGQSTSNAAHAVLSSEERAERLAQLDALRQGPPAPSE